MYNNFVLVSKGWRDKYFNKFVIDGLDCSRITVALCIVLGPGFRPLYLNIVHYYLKQSVAGRTYCALRTHKLIKWKHTIFCSLKY